MHSKRHWRENKAHDVVVQSVVQSWERTSPWLNEYIRVQLSNPSPRRLRIMYPIMRYSLSLSRKYTAGSIQSYDDHPISIITLVCDFHNILYPPLTASTPMSMQMRCMCMCIACLEGKRKTLTTLHCRTRSQCPSEIT